MPANLTTVAREKARALPNPRVDELSYGLVAWPGRRDWRAYTGITCPDRNGKVTLKNGEATVMICDANEMVDLIEVAAEPMDTVQAVDGPYELDHRDR
jgi:hypothetical protein